MIFSIKHKLFLTMLGAVVLAVLGTIMIGQSSLDRSFLRYVNVVEQVRLEELIVELKSEYQAQGNWNSLHQDPARWVNIVSQNHFKEPEATAIGQWLIDSMENEQVSPPTKLLPFMARVTLLNQKQEKIYGFPQFFDNTDFKPVTLGGATIGHIGISQQNDLFDRHQRQFLREQKFAFSIIAAGMVSFVTLVAYLLASCMIRPIEQLNTATYSLARGDYSTRVPITSSDELGQLSLDFNVLATCMQRSEQDRRQWVADISHELRTPLTVLGGGIEALQDGVLPPTTQTYDALHNEITHLKHLVSDLYELSMSDIGALSYKKVPTDPVGILEETIELFEQQFEDKGVKLTTDLALEHDVAIQADPNRLQQLFNNLLANSLSYTDAPGCLEVCVIHCKESIIIQFQDSLPGVSAANLPRLFERLYRVEESRNRERGGAGLGMAICKNIVEAHDGRICADDSPHGGLRIEVELPTEG